MEKRKFGLWCVCALAVVALAVPAIGSPKIGHFWAEYGSDTMPPEQRLIEGGGDGYRTPAGGGPWFWYPNNPTSPGVQPTQPVPGWHNQWWYDDPYDPTRYKVVTLDFDAVLAHPGAPGWLDVWVNWSLPGWSDDIVNPEHATRPPLPGPEGQYVGQQLIKQIPVLSPVPQHFRPTFDLRDFDIPYNPEWVSVDVIGVNALLSSQGKPGSIEHECLAIPEPATIGLIVLGATGLAGYVRRRRA